MPFSSSNIPAAPLSPAMGPSVQAPPPAPPTGPVVSTAHPTHMVGKAAAKVAAAHHGIALGALGIVSPHIIFLVMLGVVLLFVLMWMPATREMLKPLFGTLLIPAFLGLLTLIFRRISKIVVTIMESHKILFVNLVSTHEKIFPDIKDEEN